MKKQENIIEQPSGFLIINKPVGPTSHDIIDKLRSITGIRKIGHAGTLDPFASGVLIVAIGRKATREISNFVKLDKEYRAVLRLGVVTDSFDRTGKIKEQVVEKKPSEREIVEVLKKFVGEQKQVPPMFSAKKVKGKRLYKLARRGEIIERAAESISIFKLELFSYDWPNLSIDVGCSSGTYIRTLGHDIGGALTCGAYLEELRRTAVGDFKLADAIDTGLLNKKNWEKYLTNNLTNIIKKR